MSGDIDCIILGCNHLYDWWSIVYADVCSDVLLTIIILL